MTHHVKLSRKTLDHDARPVLVIEHFIYPVPDNFPYVMPQISVLETIQGDFVKEARAKAERYATAYGALLVDTTNFWPEG